MNKRPPTVYDGLIKKLSFVKAGASYKIAQGYLYLSNKQNLKTITILGIGAMLLVPELAFAAGTEVDVFQKWYDKISGWATGSAGKLITILSILVAGAMGILGFSGKAALGVFAVGMLLASSVTVVNMLFA